MKRARRQSQPTARNPTSVDVATRRRLLDAARRLFAERGFADVSVRDIVHEADANIALVNYYFGDKRRLYLEIIDEAITALADFNARLMLAPERSTAEERLTRFVRTFVERVLQHGELETWVHRLMEHELNRPMPEALARFAAAAIAPRIRYLARVIAELLDCATEDPVVIQCVASVHSLCLMYSRLREAPPALSDTVAEVARLRDIDAADLAEHAAAFALGGVRGLRKSTKSRVAGGVASKGRKGAARTK